MAADGGDSGHVIDSDGHNDLLREFFDFGDDLVLPDKPFEVKKEGNDYDGSGIDFDVNHFGSVDDPSDDFFMGATPSPSSSSTTSSSATSSAMTSSAPPTRSNSSLAFAMSIANDFMNIDFEGAADVDIGNLEDDLDIMSHMGGCDSMPTLTNDQPLSKTLIDPCQIKIEDKEHTKRKEMKKTNLGTAQENVQILADLNEPLKIVRSKLEKRLNVDLTSYTIWLQDTTLLNDESTLSEQCVEGTGVVKVQLNIQPVNKDGHQKINIIDVLKIDPEENGVDSADENSNSNMRDFDDEDDDFFDEDEIVDPVGSGDEATNFVESVEFCQLRKRFNYPDSVTQWTKLHTFHWAKWVNRTFPGVRLNEAKWNIDGKDFTAMSESDFTLKVGHDPGNLLWSHFTLLRQTGMATVPSSQLAGSDQSNEVQPHFNSFGAMLQRQHFAAHGTKQTYDMAAAARAAASVTGFGAPVPKKQRVILGKYEEGRVFINSDDSSNVHRTGNNGSNVQLWKFLLDILTDYRHRNIIRWSVGCEEGEFVMTEPEGVARLWGEQKGKLTMNYEKLSRALRYYKGGNILDKVHNKKFTYRFVCDLRDIVGFSASELNDRVREQAARAENAKNDQFF